jgi:hypothetical protein
MLNAYDPPPRPNVIPLRIGRAANDNALTDTMQQVDAIGLALIGLVGMFGLLLLSI